MNRSLLSAAAWLVAAYAGLAQVVVRVSLEQEAFLRNESLGVTVRIVNSSGQALRLGREPEWLSFEIQDVSGRDVPQVSKVELVDPFELESSKVAVLTTDLMPYYQLSQVGRYKITAMVKVGQLDQTFVSKAVSFDIITGTRLWEREFGVPSAGAPQVRKYSLVQANFLKDLRLYARVTDPEERQFYKVLPLGPLVSFSKPEAQLDKSSNLHVLFQTGARDFLYLVVTPEAEMIIRQTHEYYEGSRPVLKFAEEQGLRVTGGRRRVLMSDLPPPVDLPAPLPPTRPSTNAPAKKTEPAKKDKKK